MEWNEFTKVLPEDKQEIIVLDEAMNLELKRTFYKDFWDKEGRSLWCTISCKKWRKRE